MELKDTIEKPKCKYCKKTLVPVADRRKGGASHHSDWNNRNYHKKCYKQMKSNELARKWIEEILKKY